LFHERTRKKGDRTTLSCPKNSHRDALPRGFTAVGRQPKETRKIPKEAKDEVCASTMFRGGQIGKSKNYG